MDTFLASCGTDDQINHTRGSKPKLQQPLEQGLTFNLATVVALFL